MAIEHFLVSSFTADDLVEAGLSDNMFVDEAESGHIDTHVGRGFVGACEVGSWEKFGCDG